MKKGIYFRGKKQYNIEGFSSLFKEMSFLKDLSVLDRIKRLHFVGIGGSGMCPIAEILLHKGYRITGSDINESDTLERIRKTYGDIVSMGHRAENIGDAEALVYTAAVKADNPELVAAKERGIPCFERSEMLGMLAARYKKAIAVSGTHGKTTTTAMITQILMDSGRDPSAVIGGKLTAIGSNARIGSSDTVVLEACEYVDSFLQIEPHTAVILNIDADHLDYFKTIDNIIKSFHTFALQTSNLIVACGDDENTKKALEGIEGRKIITFGFNEENNYRAEKLVHLSGARARFTLCKDGCELCEIELRVPGRHNVLNALAAAAVADQHGVSPEEISLALGHFGGVHRRFEILGHFNGITVADDFAHHPTELEATLTSAMQMGYRKVFALFQPHTFSRTAMLLDDFARVLSIPDQAVISEILPVRETNTYGIHARDLSSRIPGGIYLKTFEEIADYAIENAREGDLILTIGGGDVYKCANLIVKKYQEMHPEE